MATEEWNIRELEPLLTKKDQTDNNPLGFDSDEFRLFQLFTLYNSPLVKFFNNRVLDLTYKDESQLSSLHHGELHVVDKLDKIPDTDDMADTLGNHSGLLSHDNLTILNSLHDNLTTASGASLPFTKILGFVDVDTPSEHVLLIYNQLFVGDNVDFDDPAGWNTALIPEKGIYSVGDIKTAGRLVATGESVKSEFKGFQSIGDSLHKGVLSVDGKILLNGKEVTLGATSNLLTTLFTINDDITILKAPIFRTIDNRYPAFIFRPLDGAIPNVLKTNSLFITHSTTDISGGKVWVNTPAQDIPSSSFPFNATFRVNGSSVFGREGFTGSIISTYGGSFQSLSDVTFHIQHGLASSQTLSPPSMRIDSGGGLYLQTSDSVNPSASLVIGSLTKKVGQKLYGNFHMNASLGYNSSDPIAPNNFSFAYVNETGAGAETVLGSPIAIRNDGYIGIGMIPAFFISDWDAVIRSEKKLLDVAGGADFINTLSVGYENIVTATVFENPGNKIFYDSQLGISYPVGNYYGEGGTLILRGSNVEDSILDEYDIRITGKRQRYINNETNLVVEGKYFGTRMDGKLHIYNNEDFVITNISDTPFYKNNLETRSGYYGNIIEFRTSGDFYTPIGNYKTDVGDVIITKGQLMMKEFEVSGIKGNYGIDKQGNASVKRIILPEGDTQGFLELIGIPTYEEYYYGMYNDGDIVIKDLSIYGNFAFRTRSNMDLLGGNLLKIHDIVGAKDTIDPHMFELDGDDYFGKISDFKFIEGSGETGSDENEHSRIDGFHQIRGINRNEITIDPYKEHEEYNKITGFDHILGSGNGYIRGYSSIYGTFSLTEITTHQNAVGSSLNSFGDIKYFSNIEGIGLSSILVDPIEFGVGSPEWVYNTSLYDYLNTLNTYNSTTTPSTDTPNWNKIEYTFPVFTTDWWNPLDYYGGSISHFQSITGLENKRYMGSISNFKDITTLSSKFVYDESYILEPAIKIGNWDGLSYDENYDNAKISGLFIKGGSVKDFYGVQRDTQSNVVFGFFPKNVSENGIGVNIDEPYFSFHYGTSVEFIKEPEWLDIKVKTIWLNGQELTATAKQINEMTDNGVLFRDGTNWMQSTLRMQESSDPDLLYDILNNPSTGVKHDIAGVNKIDAEEFFISTGGKITTGDAQDIQIGENALYSNLLIGTKDIVDDEAWIVPGTLEEPAGLVLAYRDANGVPQKGITIQPDSESGSQVFIPGLILNLFGDDPDQVQLIADIATGVFTIGSVEIPIFQVDIKSGIPNINLGGTSFEYPLDLADSPFMKTFLDKPNRYAVQQAVNSADNMRLIGTDIEIYSSTFKLTGGRIDFSGAEAIFTDELMFGIQSGFSDDTKITWNLSNSDAFDEVSSNYSSSVFSSIWGSNSDIPDTSPGHYLPLAKFYQGLDFAFHESDLYVAQAGDSRGSYHNWYIANHSHNANIVDHYEDDYNYDTYWLVFLDPRKIPSNLQDEDGNVILDTYPEIFYDFNNFKKGDFFTKKSFFTTGSGYFNLEIIGDPEEFNHTDFPEFIKWQEDELFGVSDGDYDIDEVDSYYETVNALDSELADRMHKIKRDGYKSYYSWMFSQSSLTQHSSDFDGQTFPNINNQSPYHNTLYNKWEYVTWMKIDCIRYDDYGNVVSFKESKEWTYRMADLVDHGHHIVNEIQGFHQGGTPIRHMRVSTQSSVLEETLFISPNNQVGINTNLYETLDKTIQYDHGEEIARISKAGDRKFKIEFEQPHIYSRRWNKDVMPKDSITVSGETLKAVSYENIDINSYYVNTDRGVPNIYTYDWFHSYSLKPTLIVNGLIQADNVDLEGRLLGDLYTDNIFLTQTIDGVENRGYMRITPEDMLIHTGTTEGRNFELYTKDKNFTIYSGDNSDVKILDIIKSEKVNIYGDLNAFDISGNIIFNSSYNDSNVDIANLNITSYNGEDEGLSLGGVLITSSAQELNILDGVDTSLTPTELSYLIGSSVGVAVESKVLVLGDSKDVDELTIQDGYITNFYIHGSEAENKVLSTAEELNYLNGSKIGIAIQNKALVLGQYFNIETGLNVGYLGVGNNASNVLSYAPFTTGYSYGSHETDAVNAVYSATADMRGVHIESNTIGSDGSYDQDSGGVHLAVGYNAMGQYGVGNNNSIIGNQVAKGKAHLILHDVMAIHQSTPLWKLNSEGYGYLNVDESTQDLIYTNYVNGSTYSRNLTADANAWLRFDRGSNIYYNEGNIGIFPESEDMPDELVYDFIGDYKLHLASGNFLLRKITDFSSVNKGTPNVEIRKVEYENFSLGTLKDRSLKIGFTPKYISDATNIPEDFEMPDYHTTFPFTEDRFNSTTSHTFPNFTSNDHYYAHIGTTDEDLYIDTNSHTHDLILQYKKGKVGIGLSHPTSLLHVQRLHDDIDNIIYNDYLIDFKIGASSGGGTDYNQIKMLSNDSHVLFIDHKVPLSVENSVIKISSQETLSLGSNVIDIEVTDSLNDEMFTNVEGNPVAPLSNNLFIANYKNPTDTYSTADLSSFYTGVTRTSSDFEGYVKTPALMSFINNDGNLLEFNTAGYLGINTGNYTVLETQLDDETLTWNSTRYPLHSQLTQPLTIDNNDVSGKGLKVVGENPTIYLGSDIAPMPFRQTDVDSSEDGDERYIEWHSRNHTSSIVMIGSDKYKQGVNAIETSQGGRLEFNFVNKYTRWKGLAIDKFSGSNGTSPTPDINRTVQLQNYAEFRIADYNDYSMAFPITLNNLDSVKHRRRIAVAEEGVGIGDSFNRGTDLNNRWQPRAMLDVSGDMRVTSKIDDRDSTYKFTRYYKNDPRILDGSDPKELMMSTDTHGYKYIGDFVIQKEVPVITVDPVNEPTPAINLKIHDYFLLGMKHGEDDIDDSSPQYFDNGLALDGTTERNYVYNYEEPVRISGHSHSWIKSGNFGIGLDSSNLLKRQTINDVVDVYNVHRVENSLLSGYNEENTTKLQVYHEDQKPYPQLDILEVPDGETPAELGDGISYKNNYDSIVKFFDDNSRFEFYPILPEEITSSTYSSLLNWAKLESKGINGGNIGEPEGLHIESDGHIILNTVGVSKYFEVLDYTKAIFKSGNSSVTTLTLDDDLNWDGKNSNLILDADFKFTGTNSEFESSTHFKWHDSGSKSFSIDETAKDSISFDHPSPSFGMLKNGTKIGAFRADHSTDVLGSDSGDYFRGLTIDLEDHKNDASNTFPSEPKRSIARFIQRINRTGDDGGYITFGSELPKKLDDVPTVSTYLASDDKFEVKVLANVDYPEDNSRTTTTGTTTFIYFEVNESNAITEPSPGTQGSWEDQMGTANNPKVLPEIGDEIEVTDDVTTNIYLYNITDFEKLDVTYYGNIVYKATISVAFNLSVYNAGFAGIDSSGTNDILNYDIWKLNWDKPEYARMTIDGKMDFEGSEAITAQWVTIDPSEGHNIYLLDQMYSGSTFHKFLHRDHVASNQEDVWLTTVDFEGTLALNEILGYNNNDKALRSDFVLKTFHWDLADNGANVSSNVVKDRVKITDSIKNTAGTITDAKIYLYEDTDIGTNGESRDLNVFGNTVISSKTTMAEIDIGSKLTYNSFPAIPHLLVTGTANITASLDVDGDLDVLGYLDVGTTLNVGSTLDVVGETTITNSILELNRIQKDDTPTGIPTDINLSGLLFNRGNLTKPSILYSEGLTDIIPTSTESTDDIFLLINDHPVFNALADSTQWYNELDVAQGEPATLTMTDHFGTTIDPTNPAVYTELELLLAFQIANANYWHNLADFTDYSDTYQEGWASVNPSLFYQWTSVLTTRFEKQRAYGSTHFSDMRLENIFVKGIYLPEESESTGGYVPKFEMLTSSASELNLLDGVNLDLTEEEINQLVGVGTELTIQGQFDRLQNIKSDLDFYITSNTTPPRTVIIGAKGLKPIADSPFYIRTRQDGTSDEFLAITKGIDVYTATDDDRGGSLQYYESSDYWVNFRTKQTQLTEPDPNPDGDGMWHLKTKKDRLSTKGYPYNSDSNPNFDSDIETSVVITEVMVDPLAVIFVVDLDDQTPYPQPIAQGQGTGATAQTQYQDLVAPHDWITVTVNTTHKYDIPDTSPIGKEYNSDYDPRTNIYDVPNMSLQEDWGDVSIGVDYSKYGLHVNKKVQQNWNSNDTAPSDLYINYGDSGSNPNWIQVLSQSNPYIPTNSDEFYRPVVGFFGKTSYGYDLTQIVEPKGSVRIRITPQPDIEWTDNIATTMQSNIAEIEVNATSIPPGQGIIGNEGALNITNYYTNVASVEGGGINFITASEPQDYVNDNNLDTIITDVAMSIGSLKHHGHIGIGTSPSNNAILTIKNQHIEGASFLGLNRKINASIKFENNLDKQKVIFLNDDGALMIANDLSLTGDPISTALQISDSNVELGKNIIPTTDLFVLTENTTYQFLMTDRGVGGGSNINSQFKNSNYRLLGDELEVIRLTEIYKNSFDKHVLVFDRDLTLSEVHLGTNLSFTIFGTTSSDGTYEGSVVSFETRKIYDPVEGGLVDKGTYGVVLSDTSPIGDSQIFSHIKGFKGLTIASGTWLNGVDLGDEGWVLFEETNHNNLGRNFNVDIEYQIQITTPHTDLWNGGTGTQPDPFYTFETRDKHNTPANKGVYKWRRRWIEDFDTVSAKGEDLSYDGTIYPNAYWTKWQVNVPYDIYWDWDSTAGTYLKNFRRIGQNSNPLSTIELSNFATNYPYNIMYNNTGYDGTTTGGVPVPIWYDSTYDNNGDDIVDDLDVWIGINPFDWGVDDTFIWRLRTGFETSRSTAVSIGTQTSPVNVATGAGSLFVGDAHVKQSDLGGIAIASSDLSMNAMTAPTAELRTSLVANGYGYLYIKDTDDLLYFLDDTNTEYNLTAGSADADFENIGMNLIPSVDNTWDIGNPTYDDPNDFPDGGPELRTFKDIYIKGDYKYWNPTTSQFQNLNSASIPYHESSINISPKVTNYTVDESYFTVLNEAFDNVNHIEFVRARFDFNPYTGDVVTTTLDTDNIYDTYNSVAIIEDFSHSEGFRIIETIAELGTSNKETIYETLNSVPQLDAWNPVNFDGSSIVVPDVGVEGHFIDNPEELILWSNIKIPQDFAKWINTNPFNIKLRAIETESVKVTITIYDANKLKTYEKVHDYDSLNEVWSVYPLLDLDESTENWLQGQEITLKITIQLKSPNSAIDISYMDLNYDTRYEYTTLLPIINFTSTTTDTAQADGVTTLTEPLIIEKNDYDYIGTNGTTSDVAIVAQGHIIPNVPSDSSIPADGWDIGSVEYPFRHAYFSDETLYLGGQKSVAWGVKENTDKIGYNKGFVGVGTLDPTQALEVSGNIKVIGSGDVNASTFTEANGTSTEWNSAFDWGNHDLVGYELANQKGVASGYASLDANSKIPTSQMPSLSLTDVSVVATQVLQLALTVEEGDVAVRTDESKSYIALNADNVDMGDWQELLAPPNLIQSVNSQTGVVVLDSDDIAEGTSNLYITDERVDERVSNLLVGGTGISLAYDNGANTLTINGSSLYTDEDAQDTIADFLIGGTGITLVEDDNANTLTINGSALYTNEDAQDTIADFLVGGTGITLVEDDNANTLTINGSALYTDENAMDAVAGMIQNGTGITWSYVDASNTLTPTITPVAGTITGDLNVVGAFSATTKSFDIEHPTKEGKRLIHGSLEGAEHGVYVRGKLEKNDEIELPDYWKELVDEDSITVQLTPIGKQQDLWVKRIENNIVLVGSSTNQIECFYFIQAERKDVEKLIVEV